MEPVVAGFVTWPTWTTIRAREQLFWGDQFPIPTSYKISVWGDQPPTHGKFPAWGDQSPPHAHGCGGGGPAIWPGAS